jgi:hypothetical protein
VVTRARYLLSDLGFWIRDHPARSLGALVGAAAVVVAAVIAIGELSDDDSENPLAPAPQVIVRAEEPPEDTGDLGFPAFATSNTTRVAGADPVADAVGVALATFPRAGAVEGPAAVTLVPADDWASGVAASALVNAPVGAPILLTDGGELPGLTADALRTLAPSGSAGTGGTQVFAVGAAPEPAGVKSERIEDGSPADVAAAVARLRERLTEEEPEHLLVASSDDPEYAMPAAAWAARSGDPVLFAQRDSVPEPTLKLIERYEEAPVYLLGPKSVISERAEKEIDESSKAAVKRAAEEDDPIANAVEFARYVDGTFGWNINDPGHGFVIADASRPADAGAAAALSGTGSWGPLLITDDADSLDPALESYLLDLKPGYTDDPTRAVYNHLWVVGDESAISVDVQVQLDEIAEVAPVRSGQGESVLGAAPGTPEPEAPSTDDTDNKR